MFPTFIGILDIQSWWEVPSIAHFCSLFRAAFNLLDFDIEDLEEALLTDGGTEGRLLQELIVRLLEGCLPNDTRNDISTFNYQMFLRRLFRKKCQEYGRDNPFNTDVDFELLPLRQKVEILRALCDFRLDAEDVEQSLDNLDSDSLRVEPLGHDRKNSAYWYFYGTRLYREDYIVQTKPDILRKQKGKLKDKRRKRRGRNRISQTEETKEETEQDNLLYEGSENGVLPTEKETIWQVVCFTHQDWSRLVEKFKNSEDDSERKLYRTLSEDFMPEIPRLFELKEKQQRHRLLQQNSTRVLRRRETTNRVEAAMVRAKAKAKIKGVKKSNSRSLKVIEEINQVSPTPSATATPVPKKGRQTNNSLASAVGQIVIHTEDELESLTGRRGGNRSGGGITSYHPSRYEYGVEEEERRVGMHKILESLKDHQDAWPFVDPVDEEYAPRYYSVVRKPMDLTTMEEKLEGGSYRSLGQFKRDFQLIVDNCRQYNGSDNEYTEMAINLQEVFDRAVDRYLESEQSSDEDPSIQVSLSPVSMCPASPSLTTKIILPQNSRKRNRNSVKKLKLSKSDKAKKDKYTSLEEPKSVETEENVALRSKRVKEKKNGKRAKRIKVEEVESDSENEITFSLAKRENQSDVEVCKMKTKQKKTVNFERVSSKVKKASPKEEQPDDSKRKSKKELKVQNEEIEDCEHDSQEILKSPARNRSKKSLKKELGDLLTKAKKSKKSDVKKNSVTFKANGKQETFETNEKIKKNHSKKDSSEKKVIPVVCRESTITDTERPKGKDKKLKQYREKDLKGSVLKNSAQKKDSHKLEKKEDDTKYKKLVTSNKDLESLDSLKDIISERQREDKLKAQIEGEKQKKSIKKDSLHSRKVPSNGSCLRTVSKIDAIHLRSKDGPKDEPVKKSKLAQVKRSRGFKKEDSPGIQALNQATEQTLNDINKWLDDAPRLSEFSSGSDSPVFHPATNEVVKAAMKTEMTRKRPHPVKLVGSQGPTRAKKVQRTIDRLQPGKSKGNLLKKPPHLPANISSDVPVNQTTADANKAKSDGSYEPKLSLGTVLRNAESIHSICKSLVSSPNPNLIDDDDEERTTRPTSALENQGAVDQTDKLFSGKEMAESKTTPKIESLDNEGNTAVEEVQKPKSATPNLSAWFKAFGAPKSKKKEDDADENATADSNCKKETENDIQEVKTIRQRRMSTGGSSISESVSSFSQESPPGQSPQTQTPHVPNETPVRGAGFYQDALSSGSSPYNSPYYATPPRYSAQLPPTPSPQNNPSSPVYPVAAPYEQTSSLYPQTTPQTSQQVYPKHSPLQGATESYRQPSPSAFSQRSPQRIPFPQNSPQGQSFLPALPPSVQNAASPYPRSPQPSQQIYPQSSPQPPANYSQPSPQQATNYSQPSPQQPPTPNYSQPSPQQPASFSQPSPQLPTNYSQPSPQTPANYSQTSPQQPSSYSQNSPQPPQTYSQPSPQPPPNYSQTSPQQPSNYSQPSPQQPPSYSQPSPQQPSSYSQPSPQQRPSYSQTSPQQPPSYSQPSPQQPPSYSQSSPQQPPPNYSQPSPQQPVPGYSQPSPQQPSTFSQPSPQQTTASNFPQNSPQQRTGYSQPSPHQPANYSQSSPQQSASYSQPSPQQACNYSPTAPSQGSNYQQGAASSYSQSFPQSPSYSRNETQGSYLQPSPAPSLISETDQRADYQKTREVKTPAVEQQSNFTSENEGQSVNQQGFQSGEQFPPASFINSYQTPSFDRNVTLPPRVSDQQQHDRHAFPSSSDSLNIHKYAQPITQQRGFGCKTSTSGDQSQVTTDQAQLLTFQQNLATHESLYQTSAGFQAPTYPVPNPSHRPVYPSPHYFDSSGKAGNNSNSGSNIAPVKKRSYSEQPDGPRNFSQETQRIQDQFGFDAMMTLSQSDPGPGSQFDGNLNSIVDSMASNSAYARLGLGLVGRTTGKEQQLLNIPRPPSKPDPITYARTTGAASDVELNLLQSLNATKSTGIVPVSRRATDKTPTSYGPNTAPTVTTSKPKKSRKTKQQQQQQQQQQQNAALIPSSIDQQSALGISGFHQFATSQTDPIPLKNPSVVTPGASAFNFAAPGTTTNAAPFYDKDATAAAFAFLDEIRNPSNYYTMALRQQQQQQHQQQQQVANSSLESAPVNSNKLSNQPSHNYPPPNPFLHSQRTTAYGPPVPPYVSPHGPNLSVDPAAYQQYLRSFYALPPPPHHHRPSWL